MIRLARVLITAPSFTARHLRTLQARFAVDDDPLGRWYTEEELLGAISKYDAVIAGLDPFTRRVIEKADRLKIVARRGIGYDRIDLAACKARGIYVTNTPVPDEHQAVAEFAVALLLDASKNITRSVNSLKNGSWERRAFVGRNIEGMTVGIVGLGNVGTRVARLVTAFGADVVYYDPYVSSKEFKAVTLPELFSSADAVSVHLVKTPETVGIVTAELLGRMKTGGIVVNTSRAEVVDRDALKDAVASGRLKAGLDVFDREPPRDDPILGFENALTTPHIAAYTVESFDAIDGACAVNVVRVLEEGDEPDHIVNR
ncbi:MAG: hypothetical protein JRN46_01355 [Nitrososphaerota archaeon]|nr:hypothetical protein [Nitrososphaerota archaeon]